MNSPDSISKNHIQVRTRFIAFLAVWLMAAVAFQVFLEPEGFTETHLTPTQQRLQWPLFTPFMVLIGFLTAASQADATIRIILFCFIPFLLIHPILVLRSSRPWTFATLIALQALTLAVGVICLVRYTQLPGGP